MLRHLTCSPSPTVQRSLLDFIEA